MSLSELKERVAGLSPEDRLKLAAFLADLAEEQEAGFRAEADRRMKAMDFGSKIAMEEFEQRHRDRELERQ
jgi:hypothetical protein